jgi:hypothetical protein
MPPVKKAPLRYHPWLEKEGLPARADTYERWVRYVHSHPGYKIDQAWPNEGKIRNAISTEELIQKIIEASPDGITAPSSKTFWHQAISHFGSWEEAIQAAGLQPAPNKRKSRSSKYRIRKR